MKNHSEDVIIQIPEALENMQLPDPILLGYYQDEANRMFWLDGEIDSSMFELSKKIIRYNKEDAALPVEERKPIKIFINSPGGDLDVALAFVGLVEISKTPVYTINICWAYSAAGLILMSGHKRFAMPNTECLIHSGSGLLGGSFEQAEEQMKNYKYMVEKMRQLVLNKTTIDPKLFKKWMNKDWYISTEEMLEYGIVDEIVNNLDDIL